MNQEISLKKNVLSNLTNGNESVFHPIRYHADEFEVFKILIGGIAVFFNTGKLALRYGDLQASLVVAENLQCPCFKPCHSRHVNRFVQFMHACIYFVLSCSINLFLPQSGHF